MWTVYILKCSDTTLYAGITNDLNRRLEEHNSGHGGRFTRVRKPVKLVYFEKVQTRSDALKREASIKRLSRSKKLELISA